MTQFSEDSGGLGVEGLGARGARQLGHWAIRLTGTQEEEIWIMQYRARLARFVRKERPP
jgi:hypothetical protein